MPDYHDRQKRQHSLLRQPCDCGVHNWQKKRRETHTPWCKKVAAMRNLKQMHKDGIISESLLMDRIKKITGRFCISLKDAGLGYWVKDPETGRWLLEGVTKAMVVGKIVPITIFKDKELKHG